MPGSGSTVAAGGGFLFGTFGEMLRSRVIILSALKRPKVRLGRSLLSPTREPKLTTVKKSEKAIIPMKRSHRQISIGRLCLRSLSKPYKLNGCQIVPRQWRIELLVCLSMGTSGYIDTREYPFCEVQLVQSS